MIVLDYLSRYEIIMCESHIIIIIMNLYRDIFIHRLAYDIWDKILYWLFIFIY
jgi:hypothetical protein